jgi:WD40 repeat protein
VAFSPDGKKVVAGNADGVIRVWDTADGKRANEWNGLAAGAYGAAFSPDGTALATAHEGGAIGVMQVKLWNPNTGKQLYALDMGKGRIDTLAYTPDGNVLVAADENGVVRFWRMKLTDEDLTVPAHGRGYAVVWSPDGGTLATGGWIPLAGGEVRLWDAKTGAPRGAAWPHKARVLALAYSPDGGTLALGADDGAVKLLNTSTGTGPSIAAHTKAARCVAFAPEVSGATKGGTVVSGGEDGRVCSWDARTGEPRWQIAAHDKQVMAVAFSPDGHTIATGSHDRTIRFWDARDGKPKGRWECGASVLALAFAPDGETLYCGESAGVRARRVATGEVVASGTTHTNWVFSVALSRDGRTLVTGSHDGTVRLWDAVGMREALVLSCDRTEMKCVSLSKDGRALAGIGVDGRVRVWR